MGKGGKFIVGFLGVMVGLAIIASLQGPPPTPQQQWATWRQCIYDTALGYGRSVADPAVIIHCRPMMPAGPAQ